MGPGDYRLRHAACAVCGADDAAVKWERDLDEGEETHLESFFRCTNAHYGRFGRIVRCRACGLLYRDPQEENLRLTYSAAVDEDYREEWPARRETFRRSLRQLHRLRRPPGDLLDVGCSTGFALRVAREAGWRAVGLEPSRWAVAAARAEGLEVTEGTLDDRPFGPERFDVVTLWDVIEHVPDPARTLRAAYDVLRPGGVIALTTMEVGSPIARLLGPRWPHLLRMHLWYFRFAHVARLLRAAGFEKPRRRPHVRVLSAAYLASRFRFAGPGLAAFLAGAVRLCGCGNALVPIYVGDLMAVYARKPGAVTEAVRQTEYPAGLAPALPDGGPPALRRTEG